MDLKTAINAVVNGRDLSFDEMSHVMHAIMGGDATQSQIAGLSVGLRMKGETADEIAAAATVMRKWAKPVQIDARPLIDTCGTGGDGFSTFNISTASAFVVASAGGYIAKHGNRAMSSKSGSADVLEAAGARIDLNPLQVAACIEETGVGFMFAPTHHGAMRHAIGPRRELGTRTFFNLLGPLTNPAGATIQIVGVFDKIWVPIVATVLQRLGAERALVVCANDGMDEISIGSETFVSELQDGTIRSFEITPTDYGFMHQPLDGLIVDSAKASLDVILKVLDDSPGPAHDIVSINAGAAIYLAGLATDLTEGIAHAKKVIADGKARDTLDHFVNFTRSL